MHKSYLVLYFYTQVRPVVRALVDHWRRHKYMLFGILLTVLTTIEVIAYYLNHPQPEASWDTASYLATAHAIQTRGVIVNNWRLPGYPLLIVLVYTLTGRDNLAAVSVTQAIFFILATLELYILIVIVLRRSWAGLLIGLLSGMNPILLSYVKPIMSEALALWLLVSLALGLALFIYTLHIGALWLVTAFTMMLFLTRAEWIYLPLPLFAYLLLITAHRDITRRLLPHVLVSLVLLYIVLGTYICINARTNHFVGVVGAQNQNIFGKVVQYDMQDEAPPQYVAISRIVHKYIAQGIKNPYYIVGHESVLKRNNLILASDYAWAIIEHHPGEFLAKSTPLALWSLTFFWHESQIASTGPYSKPLLVLLCVSGTLFKWNSVFPICAVIWILLLSRRRMRLLRIVQVMGAVVLLVLYGLILTTLGGIDSYDRLHIPFDPLVMVIVWGSLLAGARLYTEQGPYFIARLARRYLRREQIGIATATKLVISLGVVGLLLFASALIITHALFTQIGATFFLVVSIESVLCYFCSHRSLHEDYANDQLTKQQYSENE